MTMKLTKNSGLVRMFIGVQYSHNFAIRVLFGCVMTLIEDDEVETLRLQNGLTEQHLEDVVDHH